MTMTEVKVPVDIPRCDRCGATSKWVAVFPNGGQLFFCLHHHNQYEEALTKQGALLAERQE